MSAAPARPEKPQPRAPFGPSVWFSIEGGSAHWLTQHLTMEASPDVSGLHYSRADGIDFGISQLVDDSWGAGNGARLLWDGEQAHVHHVVGFVGEMRYAAEALDWQPQVIEIDVISQGAPMVKLADELHVLFGIGSDWSLRYAIYRNGQWETAELAANGRADQLLQTSDGQLHIIAGDEPVCFHHGQSLDGESWDFYEFLPESGGCDVLNATVGQDQQVHVMYRSGSFLFLASYDGTQWSAQPVDPPVTGDALGSYIGIRTSLQVDAAGTAHITHSFETLSERSSLLSYVENSSGQWTIEPVAHHLSHVMALSPEGEPIIGLSRNAAFLERPQLAIARRTGNDGIDQNCNGVDGS